MRVSDPGFRMCVWGEGGCGGPTPDAATFRKFVCKNERMGTVRGRVPSVPTGSASLSKVDGRQALIYLCHCASGVYFVLLFFLSEERPILGDHAKAHIFGLCSEKTPKKPGSA